jgi:uncharacterized protein
MDNELLSILACPICKGRLLYKKDQQELVCFFDRIAYPIKDGIPIMLENEGRLVSIEEVKELKS